MRTIERVALSVLAVGVVFTTGCGARHSDKEVYYLISTNLAICRTGRRRRRDSNRLRRNTT
jgi:hypothetical protein